MPRKRATFEVVAVPNAASEHENGFYLLVKGPDIHNFHRQDQIAALVETTLNAAFAVDWRLESEKPRKLITY